MYKDHLFLHGLGHEIDDLLLDADLAVYPYQSPPSQRVMRVICWIEGTSLLRAATLKEKEIAKQEAAASLIRAAVAVGAKTVVKCRFMRVYEPAKHVLGVIADPPPAVLKSQYTGLAVVAKTCFEKMREGIDKGPDFDIPCCGNCKYSIEKV